MEWDDEEWDAAAEKAAGEAKAAFDQAALDFLIDAGEEGYRPDPPYTVSEWADKHRVLSSKASAEAGPWRTSRTPYLREIMDNLSTYSPVEITAVKKGVQIGMSEAGFNWVGYTIHHTPGPMLYVLPSLDMVKKFSKTRIDPMIEASPVLRERIPSARSRDSGNTINQKDFPGGFFVFTGANSEAGLRGLPVSKLALDEVDGYPASAEDSGDPVTLAMDRTNAFLARRKIFLLSTPLLKESSRIDKAFREGDQRYYHVRCDKCGHHQPITWASIKWDKDANGKAMPETAGFECQGIDPDTGEFCGHRHAEHRKAALLSEDNGAAWVPSAEPSRPNYRSYHLSALYSPWYTWEECVRRFYASKDDPAQLQTFTNNVLGEPWDDTSVEAVDPQTLLGKREEYASGAAEVLAEAGQFIPDRVAIISVGVDVQPDRLEVETVGWGRDEESWSLDVQVFPGDPSSTEVWDTLDDYLSERWPHRAMENGMPVSATAIDTGGANTMDVYRFVRPREGRRIWAIKGYAGKRPVWPRKPSRNNKGKVNLYAIGVDSAKETIMARLGKVGPTVSGAGATHFSNDWDQEGFEQLTAERRRTKYVKGFAVTEWWKPEKARNERLDCRVYAFAALQGLIIMGANLNREAKRLAAKLGLDVEPPAPVTESEPVATPAPEETASTLPETNSPPPAARANTSKVKPRRKRVAVSSYMD